MGNVIQAEGGEGGDGGQVHCTCSSVVGREDWVDAVSPCGATVVRGGGGNIE